MSSTSKSSSKTKRIILKCINVCGFTRLVPDHIYDNACDTTCNECGYIRLVGGHVFDNACDDTCNECGYHRIVVGYVYDNDCDADCNICGHIREVSDHVYDDSGVCIHCGYISHILGDFDNDKMITVADALVALRIAAKLAIEDTDSLAIGDIDKDGHVTVADALAILRVAAKLVEHL